MTEADLVLLMREMAPLVRETIATELGPLRERLLALESRASIPGRDGRDGARGERGPAGESVKGDPGQQGLPGADGKDGKDGKDADESKVTALEASLRDLRSAVDAVKDIDVAALVTAEIVKAVAKLPPAKDGASVTVDDVAPLIEAQVRSAVDAIPGPKDGVSVTVDDLRPAIADEVKRSLDGWPVPRDGVGVAGAVIDRSGSLVLTLSDGRSVDLGLVVGRDADQQAIERMVQERLAQIPHPVDGKDGADGKDGKDGRDGVNFTIDDVMKDVRFDKTTKHLCLDLEKDGVSRTVSGFFPGMIYRDIWTSDRTYQEGDTVTWAGSLWVALQETQKQPGTTASGWQLAAKRGSPGKAGPRGPAGERGQKGDKGDKGPDRW